MWILFIFKFSSVATVLLVHQHFGLGCVALYYQGFLNYMSFKKLSLLKALHFFPSFQCSLLLFLCCISGEFTPASRQDDNLQKPSGVSLSKMDNNTAM